MEEYEFNDYENLDTSLLYALESKLKSNIFGQDHVVDDVVNTLKINQAGLGDEDKPLGSFLFLGSTGVGKTQLAIDLANSLNMNFERFDMSEYHSKHSKSNLIGGEKGYIGYEEGGILTNTIMENPRSVILFDEIEKADKSVLNIFLQVLDYGVLTNTKGEKVFFNETIIIFTSNLGSNTKNRLGFNNSNNNEKEKEINEFLLPEFRARLNNIIEFNDMNLQMMDRIIDKSLKTLGTKLNQKNIFLDVSLNTLDYFKEIGFKNKEGARGIDKLINTKIKQVLSNEILFGKLQYGGEVYIDVSNGNFIFDFNSTNRFLEDIDSGIYRFEEFELASKYAKANPGDVITKDVFGKGYIVRKSIEDNYKQHSISNQNTHNQYVHDLKETVNIDAQEIHEGIIQF